MRYGLVKPTVVGQGNPATQNGNSPTGAEGYTIMSDSVFKESEQSQESDTVERIKNRNLGQEPVPYPVFVKAWQESNNYDEVALKIGRSTHTVAHISNKLRKAGVKLKSMRTTALRGEALDVGALNALIDGGDEQEG